MKLTRKIYSLLCLISITASLYSQPADSTQVKAENIYKGFYIRRDFCEALSLAYDYRPTVKRSYEIALGVKSPWGLFSAIPALLSHGLWTKLAGPRVAFTYKIYLRPAVYFGPSADMAYSWFLGRHSSCTRCYGSSASIFFQRTDIAFKLVIGAKAKGADYSFGLGVRTYFSDLKINSGSSSNEVVRDPIFTWSGTGPRPPLTGFFIQPVIQVCVAVGGSKKK